MNVAWALIWFCLGNAFALWPAPVAEGWILMGVLCFLAGWAIRACPDAHLHLAAKFSKKRRRNKIVITCEETLAPTHFPERFVKMGTRPPMPAQTEGSL